MYVDLLNQTYNNIPRSNPVSKDMSIESNTNDNENEGTDTPRVQSVVFHRRKTPNNERKLKIARCS